MAWVNGRTDIVNWTNISDKTGDLFISQAEKRLAETIETFKYFSGRTEQLATILITVIPSIIIYLFTSEFKLSNYLVLTGILLLVPLIFSACFLFQNFKISNLCVIGFEPKDLVISQYIDNKFDEKLQTANITLWICEDIQRRIDSNIELNKLRKENYSKAIKSLVFIIFCPLIAGLLLCLFHCNFFVR
ncbi:MAG TPA: hypothetical protein PK323_00980 [Bacteroidia bacterium]|nr:hypothetical protein [Bacteroidia bacterium]